MSEFINYFVTSNSEWLAAMILGGLITWLAARYYYIKAGRELVREAEELKRLNILMLRGLESAGLAEFSRDQDGNIKGMVIKVSGNLQTGLASLSAQGEVISKPKGSPTDE